MKAVVFKEFGTSNVLEISDISKPTPAQGEVLIRISHTSVNPVDWKIREGHLQDLLPHIFPIVPGWDVAGEIEEVGEGVDNFHEGDLVYAYARKPTVQQGTYAEYITLPTSSVAPLPIGVAPSEAASVPLVGLTAWQGLVEFSKVTSGEDVLITAGAGGVGSFAIQFAKAKGARVITTASAKNHDYLKSLGADEVIDYTKEDVVESIKKLAPDGIDVVFDGAGGESLDQAFQVLKRKGRLVSIVDAPDEKRAADLDAKATFVFVEPNGEQLVEIGRLIESGVVRLPALQVESIREAKKFQDLNQTRHVRGKIVLKIDFA
jgi:NADPH2:quinone reductase